MFTGLMAAAMLVAKFYPETGIGRALHFYLVAEPMRLAAKAERKHLLYIVILLAAGQALMMAAPVDLALVAAWDLSVYVDAMLAVWTISAVARGKGALRFLAGRIIPFRPAARQRARRGAARPRRTVAPSNDSDGRTWVLAA